MEKSHNLLGSIVMGAFATSFGAALGLALNSMAFTAITFGSFCERPVDQRDKKFH